jgi:hypothetical protein
VSSTVRRFSFLFCLVIGVVGLAGSIAAGTPKDGDAIVAVFPPWWPASRTFNAASNAGAIVNDGAFPFVLIVQSPRPGLGARLRAAGALLLLDPLGLGGCGHSSTRKQNV